MSKRRILVTGGAGLIGCHLADHLMAHGHDVRAPEAVRRALQGMDAVVHLAAAVGAGAEREARGLSL